MQAFPLLAAAALAFAALLAFAAAPAGAAGDHGGSQVVKLAVPLKAQPFDLQDVLLLDGPFKHAEELDRQYLLSLDPDRLLRSFRVNAGLPTTAVALGGWENPTSEVRGHFVGHYLSACALMYSSTGDQRLKANADHVVAGMGECQAKIGTGYLSAFPAEFIDRVAAGKPVWAPWYTLHKIYAGLLDMYQLTGNHQALEILKKACDWVKTRTDRLDDNQMQKMLENEHGGMNEVLANLYAVIGDMKYLQLSQRFNHRAVLDPLALRQDRLTGLHANTQFPKIIGVERQYELTGDARLRTIATFFWDVVTRDRSYVIGGNSDGEHFSPKEELSKHIGAASTETCNTYNMLKITRHLFEWDPRAEYADFYERALYNHILASQNPETGMMCYYLPLKTGAAKGSLNPTGFSKPLDSFWCCTGTGVENHAKYGDSIYFHTDKDLYLNLFIASQLSWKEKGLTLRQETRYPEEDSTRLVFTCAKATRLALHIRHPYWAVQGVQLKINGKPQSLQSTPGSYIIVARNWKSGDTVDITMPMSLRTESFKDNPQKLALMYGPLVLCAETAPGDSTAAILAGDNHVLDTVKPEPGLRFAASPAVFRTGLEEQKNNVTFLPFYQEYKNPYAIYWDVNSPQEWQKKQEQRQAELLRQKELAARTVDQVTPDPESEKAHHQEGQRTGAGEFDGRRWRDASDGWFSFRLKVLPDQPQQLLCTYWGSDTGAREFDILVDGTKIASQTLENNAPGKFFDQAYPIPEALTRGKEQVTIKFQAHPGKMAGGVFDCRVIKVDKAP